MPIAAPRPEPIDAALIVDDHSLIVSGARNIIEMEAPALHVVTCKSAEQTISVLQADLYRWQLILLDLDIPGAVGLSLAMEIKRSGLESVTCILTGHHRADFIAQTRGHGFRGYILKGTPLDALEISLAKALAGETVFPVETPGERPLHGAIALTDRQIDILAQVAKGKTSKTIARFYGLQPLTIDTHLKSIMHALNVNTRAQAVSKSLELGLIRPDDEPSPPAIP